MLEKLLHVRELHYPVRPSTGGSPAVPSSSTPVRWVPA
jgi:hypothetical protein